MGGASSRAIQMLARFETHRNPRSRHRSIDFLKPRPAGSLGDQDPIERPPGPEGFPDGMDSCERRHYDKGTLMSAHENTADASRRRKFRTSFTFGSAKWLAWPASNPTCCASGKPNFPSLGPQKSGTGHRLYRRKDVELVLEIKRLLYEKRFTIEGARKFLEIAARRTASGGREPGRAPPKPHRSGRNAQAGLCSPIGDCFASRHGS